MFISYIAALIARKYHGYNDSIKKNYRKTSDIATISMILFQMIKSLRQNDGRKLYQDVEMIRCHNFDCKFFDTSGLNAIMSHVFGDPRENV